MRQSDKLALRRSELHQTITELNGKETLTDEERSKLETATNELQEVEVRWRAAKATEDAEDAAASTGTPENRELERLTREARIADVFDAALGGGITEGETRELQQHYGLAPNFVPVEIFAMDEPAPLETRAVTPAPANVGQNQHAILRRVFGDTLAAWLGVDRPTVGVGEQVFPVLTTGPTTHTPEKDAAVAEPTAGAFAAEVLVPQRAQAGFIYNIEDRARFAGMEAALRGDLRTSIAHALDAYAFSGDKGFLGANSDLAAATAANAEETFATYQAEAYDAVDGVYANQVGDIRMVWGADAYRHASKKYRTNQSDENALDVLRRITGGVRISTQIPPVAAKKQGAVVSLRPGSRNCVMPIWRGVEIIADRLTRKSKGQVELTAVTLFAFKVLRSAAFKRLQLQVTA